MPNGGCEKERTGRIGSAMDDRRADEHLSVAHSNFQGIGKNSKRRTGRCGCLGMVVIDPSGSALCFNNYFGDIAA